MYIHTPGWHTFYFKTFISISVTWWGMWQSRRRRYSGPSCSQLWLRCVCSFVPPTYLRIVFWAILEWKAAVHMLFINLCQVFFCCSLHLLMPRKLNSLHLLFSEFSTRFVNLLLRFHYCGARKPTYGHFAHIQDKAHVGLF
jgi:hypothetical protein